MHHGATKPWSKSNRPSLRENQGVSSRLEVVTFDEQHRSLSNERRQQSFWARLQVELLNTRRWATIELAAAMADYIDNFYNVERRHSYLVTSAHRVRNAPDVHLFDPSTRITTARNGGDRSWTNRSGSGHSNAGVTRAWPMPIQCTGLHWRVCHRA